MKYRPIVIFKKDEVVHSGIIDGNIQDIDLSIEDGEFFLFKDDEYSSLIKPVPNTNNNGWMEGATQEEIDNIEIDKMNAILLPTKEEIEQAKFEFDTINLLVELGVII